MLTIFPFELLAFLFFIAVIAGFLDTLAGGGGLLTLPALMMAGLPPLSALATNKLQSSIGTATATLIMLRNKHVHWDNVKWLMFAAFIGSAIGTCIIQLIDTSALTLVIPIVITFIGFYFLFTPTINVANKKPIMSAPRYKKIVIPIIGCYDGLFGPGTGSFFSLAGRALRAQAFLEATAIAKTLNFSTNIASLIVFLATGKVIWLIGFTMMLGQFIGAWLGAHSLFKIPVNYLRYLVVFMCFAMLIKYITN
jgi:uncharacterized membrane protein YfcA